VAIVGKLTQAWRSMWARALMPRSAATTARSTSREKPGAGTASGGRAGDDQCPAELLEAAHTDESVGRRKGRPLRVVGLRCPAANGVCGKGARLTVTFRDVILLVCRH
jgi:hypothetical protein